MVYDLEPMGENTVQDGVLVTHKNCVWDGVLSCALEITALDTKTRFRDLGTAF
jgi:hypothetical protein